MMDPPIAPRRGSAQARSYHFIGSCASIAPSQVPLLYDMKEAAVEVSYSTFRRALGGELLDRWAVDHGYELHHMRGLTLKSDWHVAYYRSAFGGKPCLYLVWSAYEMIWVRD